MVDILATSTSVKIVIKYKLKQWIAFFAPSDWLLLLSEYPALFNDSTPVPPSERRQTRVSCEQNAFPVCCHNSTTNRSKLFPKYMRKVTKFGLKLLTGKALSFLLEFIDKNR